MKTTQTPLATDALLEDLRVHAFRWNSAGDRGRWIGAEVECLVLSADSGRPVPLADGPVSSLDFLRRFGAGRDWTEDRSPTGAPRFQLPGGGSLTFEPGGQIEYSSPRCPSADELLRGIRSHWLPLQAAARDEGMQWRHVGVDPGNPIEHVPLQVRTERYLAMDDYFGQIGPYGAVMMRQTAAFHLNLDFENEPLERWRVLNAAAPYLVAIFANSPWYAGSATGHRSFRAHLWRELDPSRTGIFSAKDPPREYLDFCLGAPAILPGRC